MADNRKLTAGVLMMPEAQRQELVRMGDEYKRFQEADYLRKMGEQGAGLAKSVARGVPQMATGLVDLAAMPFEAAGVLEPGQAVGSTKWLESKGYLPEQQEGFANQLTELLSGGFDPSDLLTKGLPLIAGIGKTTWHGSPHGFTKFDMSKIGTGEGAQAYGHGLYLAESPGTARSYQESLSTGPERFLVNGEEVLRREAKGPMLDVSDPKTAAIVYAAREGDKGARKYFKTQGSWGEKAIAELDALKGQKITNELPGYLYKVDLPDEQISKMLDYDLPLANQPEQVKQSLLQLNDPHINQALSTSPIYDEAGDYWSYMGNTYGSKNEALRDVTPAQLISGQRGSFKSPQEASQRFYEAGIPGIQYLDQASRGAGEGTRNYVVFSDEIPQILERNGQPVAQALRNYESPKQAFDVTKQDASDIFGEGALRIRYQDPNTQGFIDVLQRPDGTASVLGLEVPEAARGKGVGQSLQQQVLSDFPEMQGQVSSKAAATTAHRIGRRPVGNPEATLDDVFRMIDEDSSVNLVSPEMQKRFNFGG